jgi:hypothetical protein
MGKQQYTPQDPPADPTPDPMKDPLPEPVRGEGDYKSARRFDDAEQAFVKSGRVEDAAGKAAPDSDQEAQAMTDAEEAGRSRSKDQTVPNRRSVETGTAG